MGKKDTADSSSNRARMPFFIVFFISMLLLLNYYNFNHFDFQFGPIPVVVFWPLLIFMSCSMIIAFVLTIYSIGPFVRGFYFFAMAWLGFSTILIIMLLVHDVISMFVTVDTKVTVKFIIAMVAVMAVLGAVHAYRVRTTKIVLKAKGLSKNMRIVQLSDLHMGIGQDEKWLTNIVDNINSLKPDMILITGDLLDGPFMIPEAMLSPLKRLSAPVYFSTGNHEFMVGIEASTSLIKKMGIRVLRNESLDLAINLQLIAVDDAWENNSLSVTLKNVKVNPSKYTILMSHQPSGFELVAKKGINLMLSGHTHGGQFFPFTLFMRLVYKRRKGLYRLNDSVLYVTMGAGTWGPPIRIGSNSEITLIELKRN